MRKKLINFVFVGIAIAGLTTVSSCKKGENDPLLSLKSRRARISGEWKLTEGTETSSQTFAGVTSTSTAVYTSSTYTVNGNSTPYTESFTIEKDGTYEMDIIDDGFAYTVAGNWIFAGKIKDLDLKNKEAIVLVTQEYTSPGYTSAVNGFLNGEVLIIDQLKNKELIFKGEYSYAGGGTSNSSTYDKTYEKK